MGWNTANPWYSWEVVYERNSEVVFPPRWDDNPYKLVQLYIALLTPVFWAHLVKSFNLWITSVVGLSEKKTHARIPAAFLQFFGVWNYKLVYSLQGSIRMPPSPVTMANNGFAWGSPTKHMKIPGGNLLGGLAGFKKPHDAYMGLVFLWYM